MLQPENGGVIDTVASMPYFTDFEGEDSLKDFTVYKNSVGGTPLIHASDLDFVPTTDNGRSVVKLKADGSGWAKRYLVLNDRTYYNAEVELVYKRTDNAATAGQIWLQIRKNIPNAEYSQAGNGFTLRLDRKGTQISGYVDSKDLAFAYDSPASLDYDDTGYTTLKVRAEGNVFTIYVNGHEVYTYTDKEGKTMEGSIAIFGNAPGNACLDSLRVTPLEEDGMAVLQPGSGSEAMKMAVNAPLFAGQKYFATTVPPIIQGKTFLYGPLAGASATVTKAGLVYVLTPPSGQTGSQEAALLEAGFRKQTYAPFVIGRRFEGPMAECAVYTKYVTAGETLAFGQWCLLISGAKPDSELYVYPSYTPAQILTAPGEAYAAQTRQWQGCATIQRLPSGRLYAGWFTGGSHEPDKGNYSTVAYSDDDGETWTDPVLVVVHPDETVRVEDIQFWLSPEGKLWMYWTQCGDPNGFDNILGTWGVVIENPDAPAEELTFTEPVRFANGLMRNRPTVLEDGTRLFMSYDMLNPDYTTVYTATAETEDQPWQLLGSAYNKDSNLFDEQMVVEKQDGSLWMLIRAAAGIKEAYSYDKGVTWTDAVMTDIAGPNSRFYIDRLPSGNLLLINHYNFSGRSHLTALLSEDDGETWPYRLLLDERAEVSYPDAVITEDGTIYVAYDRGRNTSKEILMAVFNEADIRAGALQSDTARQKVLISRIKENPSLPQSVSTFSGAGDLAVSMKMGESTFMQVTGEGITDADYDFHNGVLTIHRDFLAGVSKSTVNLKIVTSLLPLELTVVKLPSEAGTYSTDFDNANALEDFIQQLDSRMDAEAFSVGEQDGRTVLKAVVSGNGWIKNSLTLADRAYRNMTIEATMKNDGATPGFPMLTIGRSDPTASNEQAGSGLNVGVEKDGKLCVYKDGSLAAEYALPTGVYRDGEYYSLKLVVRDRLVAIYVNGTYIETYAATGGVTLNEGGYVGLAFSNATVFVDDFSVIPEDGAQNGPAASSVLYDFDDGAQLEDFLAYYSANGSSAGVPEAFDAHWLHRDGYIQRVNDIPDGPGARQSNVASLLLKNYAPQNFELSVDYLRGSENLSWAALVAKQRASGLGASGICSGFIAFAQSGGKATLWGDSRTGGPYETASGIAGFDNKQWHTLKLRVVNKELSVFIDGKLYLQQQATSDSFLEKGILGLQSLSNACRFDNLALTVLDENGAPTALASVLTDQAIADAVVQQIAQLPTVEALTLDDAEKVAAARRAYSDLTDDQKALVSSEALSKLQALEQRLVWLESEATTGDPSTDPTSGQTDGTKSGTTTTGETESPVNTGEASGPILPLLMTALGAFGVLLFGLCKRRKPLEADGIG